MPEKPTTPPDDLEDGASGFLRRWSDRKARAASDDATPTEPVAQDDAAATEPAATADGPDTAEAPPSVTEADLENLTYDSDYTKFMGEHVPEALRRRALRQLWRSDPILANLDGLCDYDDDFTDAALAVKVLQTAHKVGQGYLTDDEVAANRARGKPKNADDVDEMDDLIDDEGEDMEDFDAESDAGPEVVADEQSAVATVAGEDAAASSDDTGHSIISNGPTVDPKTA